MKLNEIPRLIRRSLRARKYGVSFYGTSRFKLPEMFLLGGSKVGFAAPAESGPAHDFINVAIDDEYGIRSSNSEFGAILDIGANCGLFSLLASHYHPSARIHAYEPNPRSFSYASRNLENRNVTLFQAGIAAVAARASIYDEGDSTLSRTVVSELGEIELVSFDEAIRRIGGKVDLLKLDCEGAEWDIFGQLDPFQQVQEIRMEYHLTEGHTVEDVKKFAEDARYNIDKLVPNRGFGIAWLSRKR